MAAFFLGSLLASVIVFFVLARMHLISFQEA